MPAAHVEMASTAVPVTSHVSRADARAAKAHAKALRPWYKKKRYILSLGVIAIVVIAVIANSGGGGGGGGPTANPQEQEAESAARLFPERVDAQPEDQERQAGQSATIGDLEATMVSGGFQQSLNEFENAGYLVLNVSVKNNGQDAKPYNTFDWKVQTPGGQVVDPSAVGEEQLGSGDLVAGGSVSGKIIFEIKDQRGDFYPIYKPEAFDAARGVWKVTI